jgi:hypothetical protein
MHVCPRAAVVTSPTGERPGSDVGDGRDRAAAPAEPADEHLRLADVPLAYDPGVAAAVEVDQEGLEHTRLGAGPESGGHPRAEVRIEHDRLSEW